MIIYEDLGNGFIKAVSNNNKYLIEHPTEISDVYIEAINKGKIINGIGIFDNNYTYTESEIEIENIEVPEEIENK